MFSNLELNQLELKESISYAISRFVEVSGLQEFNLSHVWFLFSTIAAVFVVELIAVKWQNSALRKIIQFDKSARNDLFYWLTEICNIFNLIAFVLTFGIAYFLVGLIQNAVHFELGLFIRIPILQFVVIYLISDLNAYFNHWVFHRIRPLWKLHEFHHSATSFTILTRYRGHFVEMSLKRFIDVLPFVIVGAPIQTYIGVKILKEIHGLMVHSNITSGWGFIGRYLIVSPAAHRIHHSINPEHYGKNFGNTFIIWDRIFGTYLESDNAIEIGVPDNPYNKKGVVTDVFIGIKRFFRGIFFADK